MQYRIIVRVIILLGFILGAQPSFGLKKVSVGLKWVHQFQFAGIYAAKLKGFYKEAGLEVEIIEKQKNTDLVQALIEGKYDFIINDSAIVKSRLEGKKVIILSTLFQRSPLVFISLKEKNIHSPADWVGKKVMYSKDIHQPIIDLLLKESGTAPNTVYHVNHSFKLDELLNGNIDAMTGYLGSQSYFYQKQGKPLNIIYPANYGLDFYGDLVVTTESYFNKNINAALAFRQATLKGWDYALNHIDELVDHIYQSYSKHKSKEALKHEAFYIKKCLIAIL